MSHEKRSRCVNAEVRDVSGKRTLFGRPIVYNSPSEMIAGYFREILLPGCFAASLGDRTRDVIACVNHDPRQLLGRLAAGTLRLAEDADGVTVECPAPDTSYARDLIESVSRGDIRGMSFIFEVVSDAWSLSEGVRLRTVKKANLYEVSWVTDPAYPQTEAGVRSRDVPGPQHTIRRCMLDLIERQ
jgi:uncharacterized protein